MILALLLSFFGANSSDCTLCAWPNVATSNQRGECVIGVGLQANLSGSCTLWCTAWGNQVSGQTLSNHLVSFDASSSSCICQRLSSSGVTEYASRPRKSCTSWGPSDDYINSMKDYSPSTTTWDQSYYSSFQNYGSPDSYQRMTSPITQIQGTLNLPNGLGYIDANLDMSQFISQMNLHNSWFTTTVRNDISLSATHVQHQLDSAHRSIMQKMQTLDSSMNYINAKVSGLASANDLQGAFDRLNYAINSRSGGGASSDPTDLSGVLSSIAAARADNLAATAGVQESLDAMNINLAGRVSAVGDSVSSLRAGIGAIGDSLKGVKGAVEASGRLIDSGATARWRLDHDSGALAGDGLRSKFDSVRGSEDGSSKWSAESTGVFTGYAKSNETHLSDISNSLESMKTFLLGNSCTEFPSWSVSVMGANYDLGSNFNSWPLIFTLMRFLGRFAGAFMGFKVVFWAITRGGENGGNP